MQSATERQRDAYEKAREAKRAARELADLPECLEVPAGRPKETFSAQPDAALETGETSPLLVNLDGETWLANRLLQHGIDIYAGGPYASYADRLGAAIIRNGIQCVIVGRKDGSPESYAKCFERIAGKPLEPKPTKQKTRVPRGTNTTVEST
jgi:hypothetical protein